VREGHKVALQGREEAWSVAESGNHNHKTEDINVNEYDKARMRIHRHQVAALVLGVNWEETNARLAALRAEVDAAEVAYRACKARNDAARKAEGCA